MRITGTLLTVAALAVGFVAVSFTGKARGQEGESDPAPDLRKAGVMDMDVDFLREKGGEEATLVFHESIV